MKTVRAVALIFVLSVLASSQPHLAQEAARTQAPFTLTITGNLKPGDSLHWDFANSSQTVRKAGEMIVLGVDKTNVSSHEITKKKQWDNFFGCQYDVRDSSGDPVRQIQSTRSFGSIIGSLTPGEKEPVLEPGESDVSSVRLDESLDLSQPGTYTIQAWAHAWDDPKSPIVRSNTLTLVVEPADASPPQ